MPTSPALHSFSYALDYLREQVADVSEDRMTALPPGCAIHPAWIIGHLTLTCQLLAGAIGVQPWLPADYAPHFGTGSVPTGRAYEAKIEALARLSDAQAQISAAVERLTEAQLDQPFPDPAYLDVFPTIRHSIAQVLVGHASFHVGQVSMWRRAMGLPRMTRGFE